jgi:hypothetical protein
MSGFSGNLLDSIAHPATVNPLQVYGDAAKTANAIWATRQAQADQAAGQAFQQSIDPVTGQPNQAALMRGLAASPTAALAAQASAQRGQTLDTNTYDLHSKRLGGAMQSMAQLLADNPNGVPQAAAFAAIDNARKQGLVTDEEVPQLRSAFGADPHANTAAIVQGMTHNLTTQQALDAARPPSTLKDAGGYAVPIRPQSPLQSGPYTGSQEQAPGGVKLGPRPDATQEYTFQPKNPDGSPVGPPVKFTAPFGTVFPETQGATIIPTPATSAAPAAPGAAPGQPPPAFAPGYTGRGTPNPPNPALANPNKEPPAPGTTPPPASTTPPPAATQPPAGGVATSAPMGTEETVKSDVTQFKNDQTNLPKWQTTDQNLGHAYEALKLTTTGRSTESTHALYSFLNAQGALPPGMEDNVKNYDLFKKYTERVIADLGNAAGTDQGRQLAAMSNAGTGFSTAANMEIMRNDIAKNRQQMAAIMTEDQNGSGYGYGGRRASVANTTDPRGFAWNLYTPAEQQKILTEVKGNKAAEAKLYKAMGMADMLNLHVTPGQTPPRVPAAPVVTPPGPRAMLMPQPGQNALAAYG